MDSMMAQSNHIVNQIVSKSLGKLRCEYCGEPDVDYASNCCRCGGPKKVFLPPPTTSCDFDATEETQAVLALFGLIAVLVCVAMIGCYWDHVRCWLPDVPRINRPSGSGPTLLEG